MRGRTLRDRERPRAQRLREGQDRRDAEGAHGGARLGRAPAEVEPGSDPALTPIIGAKDAWLKSGLLPSTRARSQSPASIRRFPNAANVLGREFLEEEVAISRRAPVGVGTQGEIERVRCNEARLFALRVGSMAGP